MFGIKMPEQPDKVDIQGWVLCIGMSDIKAFGAYNPDFLMSGFCQRLAADIWNKSQGCYRRQDITQRYSILSGISSFMRMV